MIRSIEVTNLRGIQQGKLDDLTPLTILVGPNGSGKSTILDALLIGASSNPEIAIRQCIERRLGGADGARWLFWRGNRKSQAQVVLITSEGKKCQSILSLSENGIRDIVSHQHQTSMQEVADAAIGIQSGSIGSTVFRENSEELFKEVPPVYLVESQPQPSHISLPSLLTQAIQEGKRDEVRDFIADVVPGLKNIIILVKDDGATPLINLEFDDHALPAALAGDGIQTLLHLCLELAARPGGVVLLEEPEVHQHPAALRQTARAILAAIRRNIQVILTTHSIELIDVLLSETKDDEELAKMSVYGLVLQDGCLKSYRVVGHEIAFARVEIGNDLR